MAKTIEKISSEFVKEKWISGHKVIEKIFREFYNFYGLQGKNRLDNAVMAGDLEVAIVALEEEYNKIPYIKRSYLIL